MLFLWVLLALMRSETNSTSSTEPVTYMQNMSLGQISEIRVGLLIPSGMSIDDDVGFNGSAGAVVVALQKAIALKIYDPSLYKISFFWAFDQCDESKAAGFAAQLITRHEVNSILGPVCPLPTKVVGALAAYKKIPIFTWGVAMSPDFYGTKIYTTTQLMSGTVRGTMVALANLLTNYNWTQIAFIYNDAQVLDENIPICGYFSGVFESGSNFLSNDTEAYTRQIRNTTVENFRVVLRNLRSRARIIIACLESAKEKRNLMEAAALNDMVSSEFVYIFIQTNAEGFGNPPFWQQNVTMDARIKEAAKTVLILDKFINDSESVQSVRQEIANAVHDWPFYSTAASNASNLAVYLGDSMMAYMIGLNRTYGKADLKNGTAVLENMRRGTSEFPSIYGNTYTFAGGIRAARYALIGLDAGMIPNVWAVINSISVSNTSFNVTYKNAAETIWANRNGQQPLSFPACGFQNERCVQNPILYTILTISAVTVFFLILLALFVAIYFFQNQQRRRLNSLWQIPFILLDKAKENSFVHTSRSNQSDSQKSGVLRKSTDKYEFFMYSKEPLIAIKNATLGRWSAEDEEEFRFMRQLDHENLNRFIGISIADGLCYFLWNYCDRGSLMELIHAHAFRIDPYIMTGMIKDIAEGLFFVHNSRLQQHGNLSAFTCVVGDRFEIKIQFYGMKKLKQNMERTLNHSASLYVAPEHIHQNAVGSQAGDVYSFAILCSTILSLEAPFDGIQTAELFKKIADGDRPQLETENQDPELIKLIRRCWCQIPSDRPKISEIRSVLILQQRSSNVMDHMFSLMENNAAELEQDVQMRRLELLEEKKKADILLNRMMPKEAAEKLKLGQSVEPQVYTEATVFFSDIVGFTVLASKSSPLQIINFLNNVYTLADEVIGQFDAYKVETIGDGMHVVSSIPKRNGHQHGQQIGLMAMEFQRAVKTLRMAHLPNHQIQMRVGVHTGSCVAGIVGMTAPRFCVFGDTVNIAAKMEASGRAGRIHITDQTNSFLQTHFPGQFTTMERGESLIKGIGTLNTHWLVPPEELNAFEP